MSHQPSPVDEMSDPESDAQTIPQPPRASWPSRVRKTCHVVANHALKHTGVGIICAVAYFDPGNWGVDLQAGSQYGYKLLFVVLLAGIFAAYLQVLASRLGCVTGLDLASHCRLLLHDRPKHKLLYRWGLLYPLYALSEIAILSTDLAELLGSAIALCLLFPSLPLWGGVLLTSADVFLLLAMRDPLGGSPVRLFELLIAGLVFTVLVCIGIIISKVHVQWGNAFDGFVPSSTLFKSGGLYTAIGIIGATVMPHSIFLGSALATQDRVNAKPEETSRPLSRTSSTSSDSGSLPDLKAPRPERLSVVRRVRDFVRGLFWVTSERHVPNEPKSHAERENNSLGFVRAHIYHGMVDIVVSLFGLAVIINALILILAGAVFYYGSGKGSGGPASLFDAHRLLASVVGKPAATLFALALLASGQSSSIIATMAGQTVSEGFLRWRVSPVMRRLLTRSLGLFPSMAVAIGVGQSGVNTLLVVSQVILSIVLPFIIFPLLWLTSSKLVMQVKVEAIEQTEMLDSSTSSSVHSGDSIETDVEAVKEEKTVDYSNGILTIFSGYLIWLIVVASNVYAIVSLGLGTTG